MGHVRQTDNSRTTKRTANRKPIGGSNRERPRKIWIGGVEDDLRNMNVRC